MLCTLIESLYRGITNNKQKNSEQVNLFAIFKLSNEYGAQFALLTKPSRE